jgi:hypothetical protein
VLRDLKRKGTLSSFLVEDVGDNDMDDPTVSYYDDMYEEMYQDGATPSYEYYQAAAEETEPGYKVELAKSGRSQCDKCKKEAVIKGKGKTKRGKDAEAPEEETAPVAAIPAEEEPKPANTKRRNSRRSTRAVVVANKTLPDNKSSNTTAMLPHASYIPIDAVRVGSLNELSGSYGRWNHLACWRGEYNCGMTTKMHDHIDNSVKTDKFNHTFFLLTMLKSPIPRLGRFDAAHQCQTSSTRSY